MLEKLLWSVLHRPYVFLFLLSFLALCWLERGSLRTLLWLVSGYFIAFAAEWGSIHHGIPFGYYVYHDEALANDLTLAGVPFFDSLSFAFLSYVSYSFALYYLSPLWVRRWDVQRVESRAVAGSPVSLFLGAVLMVVIDLIVDPVAHLGAHWFLGDIYHYPDPGWHFDVPLANYLGWFVVGWAIIFVNQRLDRLLHARDVAKRRARRRRFAPFQGLFAPLFWAGVLVFQLGVTAWLGWGEASTVPKENLPMVRLQTLAGAFIVAPIVILAAVQLLKPSNRARREEIEDWLADGPCPRLERALAKDFGGGEKIEEPAREL